MYRDALACERALAGWLAVNLSFDATPPYSTMRLLRVLALVQMGEGLIQGTPAGAVAEPSQAGDELSPEDALLCAPARRNLSFSTGILKMALYTYSFGNYRHEISKYRPWDDFHGQDSHGN